jgi:putative ABC transport system permease protein
MSLVVAERTRELGIRLALGAEPRRLRSMVVRHALALTATGIGIGLALFAALSPLITRQLYGVAATDPLTLAAVAATLLLVATTAAAGPARRVLRVDPLTTLRCD